MKEIEFNVNDENWTKLIRNIRVNGTAWNKEFEECDKHKSFHYENGHEITKQLNGNIMWLSTTTVFDRPSEIIIKDYSFRIILDANLNFIEGSINLFAFGWKSLNNNEYQDVLSEIQSKINRPEFWDRIETKTSSNTQNA